MAVMNRFPRHAGCALYATVAIALAGCSSKDEPVSRSAEPVPAESMPAKPAPPSPPTPPPDPCAALAPSEQPPLALLLASSSNDRIDAIFCSTSAHLQRVLVPGGCGQRVMLELEHERDGILERFDIMSVAECSGIVSSSSFRELAAGEHFVAESGTIAAANDAHELSFGTLIFRRIPRGRVTMRGEFVSRTDRSDDKGRIEAVWLGRLEARPLVVELGAP